MWGDLLLLVFSHLVVSELSELSAVVKEEG